MKMRAIITITTSFLTPRLTASRIHSQSNHLIRRKLSSFHIVNYCKSRRRHSKRESSLLSSRLMSTSLPNDDDKFDMSQTNQVKNNLTSSLLLNGFHFIPPNPLLGTLTAIGGMTIAVALGFLYMNQEKLLYFPDRQPNSANPYGFRSPEEYDMLFEEHWISTEDGIEIHSWLLLHEDDDANTTMATTKPTIVFFHGNAGNIGYRLPIAKKMLEKLRCNVLMVEYRGYGDSRSYNGYHDEPNEAGLKLDAEYVINFIQKHSKIDSSKIFLYGSSLGGAVAFHIAEKWQQHATKEKDSNSNQAPKDDSPPQIAGVIVENTFSSIDAMVDVHFPILRLIKGLILRMHWNSKGVVQRGLVSPILYLSGDQDEIVPAEQMQELYKISKVDNNSNPLTRIHVIKEGMHNDSWLIGGKLYWDAIDQFIQDVTNSQENI